MFVVDVVVCDLVLVDVLWSCDWCYDCVFLVCEMWLVVYWVCCELLVIMVGFVLGSFLYSEELDYKVDVV